MRRTVSTLAVAAALALTPIAADAATHHGFTVHGHHGRSMRVGYHGVVRHSTLPHCAVEDASSGPTPCTWNIGSSTDGNGIGLAYWINYPTGPSHYVWAQRPTVNGWHWLDRGWINAMRSEDPHQNWKRCVIKIGGTTFVRCPDGSRWSS